MDWPAAVTAAMAATGMAPANRLAQLAELK
jgi:hypothetical protein